MSKHTPEPWALRVATHANGVIIAGPIRELRNGVGTQAQIAATCAAEWMGGVEQAENARRIVACVNACKGLDTALLESSGLVSAVGYELIELTKQRDELLDLLSAATRYVGDFAIRETMALCLDGDDFDVLYEDSEGREGWATESITNVAGKAAKKLSELAARITDDQREEIVTVLQAISGGFSDDPAQDAQTLLAKMTGEQPGFGQSFAPNRAAN